MEEEKGEELDLKAKMEASLPKADEDATLWECEELALRYLLEDGNLLFLEKTDKI